MGVQSTTRFYLNIQNFLSSLKRSNWDTSRQMEMETKPF